MAEKTLNWISAMVCAVLSYSYGELDGMLKALIFCMIIDYITGLITAYKNKELSSEVGFLGLAKKFVMLLIVAVAHIIDMELFSNDSNAFHIVGKCNTAVDVNPTINFILI